MAEKYMISIDQSTQGTKALLFDEGGSLIKRISLTSRLSMKKAGCPITRPRSMRM